jgi:hypothetical protein
LLLSGLVLVHGCQGVIEVDVKNEKKGNNEWWWEGLFFRLVGRDLFLFFYEASKKRSKCDPKLVRASSKIFLFEFFIALPAAQAYSNSASIASSTKILH